MVVGLSPRWAQQDLVSHRHTKSIPGFSSCVVYLSGALFALKLARCFSSTAQPRPLLSHRAGGAPAALLLSLEAACCCVSLFWKRFCFESRKPLPLTFLNTSSFLPSVASWNGKRNEAQPRSAAQQSARLESCMRCAAHCPMSPSATSGL